MPKTAKGKKIYAAMVKQYGKARGDRVFYASENAGTIKGVHKMAKKPIKKVTPKSGGTRSMPGKPSGGKARVTRTTSTRSSSMRRTTPSKRMVKKTVRKSRY